MRVFAALALIAATSVACGSGLFQQYEYEEDMYLSLDRTATVYVNASVAALNALRGTNLDVAPGADLDRTAVGTYFTTPFTRVTKITTSRRSNRQFVHVRLSVDDVGRLSEARPFGWSTYRFGQDGDLFVYRQDVGAAVREAGAIAGWTGGELVAFRLHLPSKIVYHNAGPANLRRGNILVWEQPLAERLRGTPLSLDVRMETQSILYSTILLFGATLLAVAAMFAIVIWWVVRRAPASAPGKAA